MASKASMLKQGANKTGRGLFNNMTPLSAREGAVPKDVEITNDIEKEEKMTEEVKEIPVVNEVVEEKAVVEEPVVKEEPKIEKQEAIKQAAEEKTVVIKEINETINKPEKAEKIPAEKPASRYEKEKFLLLDVRGYRDYVEHMAKASNKSVTKYIRNLIQQDMEKNMDIYEAHKALEEKLRGRTGN